MILNLNHKSTAYFIDHLAQRNKGGAGDSATQPLQNHWPSTNSWIESENTVIAAANRKRTASSDAKSTTATDVTKISDAKERISEEFLKSKHVELAPLTRVKQVRNTM